MTYSVLGGKRRDSLLIIYSVLRFINEQNRAKRFPGISNIMDKCGLPWDKSVSVLNHLVRLKLIENHPHKKMQKKFFLTMRGRQVMSDFESAVSGFGLELTSSGNHWWRNQPPKNLARGKEKELYISP